MSLILIPKSEMKPRKKTDDEIRDEIIFYAFIDKEFLSGFAVSYVQIKDGNLNFKRGK